MYFLPPKEVSKRKCFLAKGWQTLKFYLSSTFTPQLLSRESPLPSSPSLFVNLPQNEEVYGNIWLVQNSLEMRDTTPRILEEAIREQSITICFVILCVLEGHSTKCGYAFKKQVSCKTKWMPCWLVVSSFVVIPLLSCVQLSVTPWTTAHQASLSFTIS